jgi:hypothetical protein
MVRSVKVGGDHNCSLAVGLTFGVCSTSGSVPQEAAVLLRAPQHVAWIRQRASFSLCWHTSQRPGCTLRACSPVCHHEVHLGPLSHLHRLQFLNWPLGSWRSLLLSLSSRRLLRCRNLIATVILALGGLSSQHIAIIFVLCGCWWLLLSLLCCGVNFRLHFVENKIKFNMFKLVVRLT